MPRDVWITGPTLAALAARGLRERDTFTSADLMVWVPQLKGKPNAWSASKPLVEMGFVTATTRLSDNAESQGVYTVTKSGAAAILAAGSGRQLKSGPKGPHGKNRAIQAGAFISRLWALLRARRMLDSETAAATLVDAGRDDEVRKAAGTAKRYFHRWAQIGVVKESARRLPNGCKRYVLVRDVGPVPPAWTPKAQRRSGCGDHDGRPT